jgi:hypothetical protein
MIVTVVYVMIAAGLEVRGAIPGDDADRTMETSWRQKARQSWNSEVTKDTKRRGQQQLVATL